MHRLFSTAGRRLLVGGSAGVLAASWAVQARADEPEPASAAAAKPDDSEEDLPVPSVIGLYLNKEAHEKLRAAFGVKFADSVSEPIPLLLEPTKQQANDLKTLCGSTVKVKAVLLGDDEHSQSILVHLSDETGEITREFSVHNPLPSYTISRPGSTSKAAQSERETYGRLFWYRVAHGNAAVIDYDTTEDGNKMPAGAVLQPNVVTTSAGQIEMSSSNTWDGVLPSYRGNLMRHVEIEKVAPPPPSPSAAAAAAAGDDAAAAKGVDADGGSSSSSEDEAGKVDEPIMLTQSIAEPVTLAATKAKLDKVLSTVEVEATFCTDVQYDLETGKCEELETCGFCRFMKGGPCGDIFRVWERCVFGSKAKGESFIQNCGKATFGLKDCTEANPTYYADVISSDEDPDAEDSKPVDA